MVIIGRGLTSLGLCESLWRWEFHLYQKLQASPLSRECLLCLDRDCANAKLIRKQHSSHLGWCYWTGCGRSPGCFVVVQMRLSKLQTRTEESTTHGDRQLVRISQGEVSCSVISRHSMSHEEPGGSNQQPSGNKATHSTSGATAPQSTTYILDMSHGQTNVRTTLSV